MGETSLEGGFQVDHIRTPLHCQITALRLATPAENRRAASGSSTARVPVKGVWLHKNGSYVVEYQYPSRKDIKVTKQQKNMTRSMASELFNRISKHYSPEFAYQNPVDEELTSEQEKGIQTMFEGMVKKIESKLACSAVEPADDSRPAKKQRVD
jgi:hypothetical protein